MIEGRAIILNIDNTRSKLEKLGAIFKSDYAFKDVIFILKNGDGNLSNDYLRIRAYSKNNWSTKNVVLTRKQAKFQKIGKEDVVILKKE